MNSPGWALLLSAWLALNCIQCSKSCQAAQTQVINLENVAQWSLSNVHGNNSISLDSVTIPSYVLDTLQQQGLINPDYQDLAYRYKERDLAWIANDTWTYTASWNLPSNILSKLNDELEVEQNDYEAKIRTYTKNHRRRHLHALLILHGIDTAATITLNNHSLGSIANSHRRHVFEITESVLFGSTSTNHVNILEITIQPAAAFAATQAAQFTAHSVPYTKQLGSTGQYNFIRKAASDFGWDWGPSFAPAGISAGVEIVFRNSDSNIGDGEENLIKKVNTIAATTAAPVYLMDVGVRQHHFMSNDSILVTADAFFRPLLTSAELEGMKKEKEEYFSGVLEIEISGPATSNGDLISKKLPIETRSWSSEVELHFSSNELLANSTQHSMEESADWVIQRSIDVLVTPPYELWWPWDLGTPVLYNVTVTFKPFRKEKRTWSLPGSILQLGRGRKEESDGRGGDGLNYQVVHRQVGFRTIELIQDPIIIDTSDNTSSKTKSKKKKNKSEVVGETFYFKVNNVSIFARGANIVPLDSIPTKVTPNRIKQAILSARRANMNFLRVWGGGRYFSNLFYEECDKNGILVWQEFTYACAMYPSTPFYLHEAKEEARQQVLRLNSHPSVAIWGGNNENEAAFSWFPETKAHPERYRPEYEVLFLHVLREELLSLDPGAVYVDSSPSNGLVAKKNRSSKNRGSSNLSVEESSQGDGFSMSENSKNKNNNLFREEGVVKKWGDVTDPSQGDVHFYDYSSNLLDATTYPPAKFISEFGYMSLPSFASYAKQSKIEDWVVDSELMEYRMRHADGLKQIKDQFQMHFRLSRVPEERKNKALPLLSRRKTTPGEMHKNIDCTNYNSTVNSTNVNMTGDDKSNIDVFQAFIYLTQLQQALIYETAANTWRRGKTDHVSQTAGLLYWQLNDVWAGPSWSGINYDGRWKALHYLARRFFSPVAVFGNKKSKKTNDAFKGRKKNFEEEEIEVWIVNDGREDVQGRLEVYAIPFQSTFASEMVDMLSISELTVIDATAAGTTGTAAPSSSMNTNTDINSRSTITVPGSGSVIAWTSNFSETQWGSVQSAASHVYLHLRFCTAQNKTESTTGGGSGSGSRRSGDESCIDNVMLLGELKDASLAEEVNVTATVEVALDNQLKGGDDDVGGGGSASSSLEAASLLNSTTDNGRNGNLSTNRIFEVTLTAQGGVALYVFLESSLPGFFSDNLIMVVPWEPLKILFFLDENEEEDEWKRNTTQVTEEEFRASLRVIWLQKALNHFPVVEEEEKRSSRWSLLNFIFSIIWFIQNSLLFKLFFFSSLIITGLVFAYRSCTE